MINNSVCVLFIWETDRSNKRQINLTQAVLYRYSTTQQKTRCCYNSTFQYSYYNGICYICFALCTHLYIYITISYSKMQRDIPRPTPLPVLVYSHFISISLNWLCIYVCVCILLATRTHSHIYSFYMYAFLWSHKGYIWLTNRINIFNFL